jgi:hypothetical protein
MLSLLMYLDGHYSDNQAILASNMLASCRRIHNGSQLFNTVQWSVLNYL